MPKKWPAWRLVRRGQPRAERCGEELKAAYDTAKACACQHCRERPAEATRGMRAGGIVCEDLHHHKHKRGEKHWTPSQVRTAAEKRCGSVVGGVAEAPGQGDGDGGGVGDVEEGAGGDGGVVQGLPHGVGDRADGRWRVAVPVEVEPGRPQHAARPLPVFVVPERAQVTARFLKNAWQRRRGS